MFNCTKCGLCCKNIGEVSELKAFDSGNGVCVYLTDDNLCSIYSSRPDICSVDIMYEKKYQGVLSREEYDRINLEGCRLLKENNSSSIE